jgi:serine/threonine protein kinase
MPPPATFDELVDLVKHSRAADDSAVERFRTGHKPIDTWTPEAAAEAMVREGLLTQYQAQRILRGESGGLWVGDRYRVLSQIGGGGMGRVYLCEDTRQARAVAVKVMPAALSGDPGAVARFRREQRASAVLDHPAIVRAVDVGQYGKHPFLVLEFVDGADLFRYVTIRGPLDSRVATHYVSRAAEALQRAADQGWVHRDVKPHNLMVDRTGRIRVLDLGLARSFKEDSRYPPVSDLESRGSFVGTADFIAPEQAANSSRVDGRADIYSLGATLYFLLAGRPPFPEGTVAQKLNWHRTRDPVPISQMRPDVPSGMASVLAKMMAKAPGARYQAPVEVAAALVTWAEPPPAAPDPAGLPDWPPAVRRILGLPASLTGPKVGAAGPMLPSSFPGKPASTLPPATRSLPGWAAVGSMLVGLITALLLAFRSPPPGPAPSASAAPPSAGAYSPAVSGKDATSMSGSRSRDHTPDR